MPGEVGRRRRSIVDVRYRCADGGFVDSTLDRVDVELLAKAPPVREFRWYRGRQFYSGWYWASTTEGLVAHESRLELARIMLADCDPSVVAIVAQPFQLRGDDGDRPRRHVPDLLLINSSGLVTIVDVKPAHRVSDPDVAAVFAWTEQLAAARGWAFEIWTGADATLLANVQFLAGYRRRSVIREELVPVAMELAPSYQTLGQLESALADYGPIELARPVVLHLLWSGSLRADLNRPLHADMRVSVGRSVAA